MDVAAPKSFSWSYSKLKAFEICPRRYYETDILKAWPQERSDNLTWGDAVHKEMADALRGKDLSLAYSMYQHWIDKVNATKGELLVEDQCKWAVTRDLTPTAWFSKTAWARTVADAVKIDLVAPATALVVDWKTGKSANVDEVQLILTSLMALIHFPKLQCVRSDFVWLQEDDKTTQVIYRNEAADHWAEIMPRVEKLQQATANVDFPPRPNSFCRRWCPVKTCEYWGT